MSSSTSSSTPPPRDDSPTPPVTPLTPRAALVTCAALLLLFGFLSFSAAGTKCATFDETLHAPAGYTYLRYFDFRANPEHPPLWKYWEALPWLIRPPASANVKSPEYAAICDDLTNQWDWAQRTMYRTPGNDAERLLGQSRFMMMLLALACGGVLSWWAYRLGGPLAAVVACALYALDPNFTAHASLVTNDVAFCLTVLALSYFLWRIGQRITIGRALAVALLCGVSITTKFTGVLTIPVIGVTLLYRALAPEAWPALRGMVLGTRWRRLAAVAVLCVVTGAVTYGTIWGAYGFRGRTAPDPQVHANVQQLVAEAAVNEIMSRTGRPATKAELHAWYPSPYPRAVLFTLQHHLLPDAFLNGLFFAYSKSLFRYAFLLGHVYGTGRWYYFPVAVLVKTPIATLVALAGMLVALVVSRRALALRRDWWVAACLVVPPVVFGAAAMASHMNIGIRHFFPVYIYAFVVAGVVAGRLYAAGGSRRVLRGALVVLAVGLAAESFAAYPNYIPFFNVAAGGYRGGIHLLGDSNLDWGQDLPLVAAWQREHPYRTLYLAYFGTADPAYYGIRARRLTFQNGLEVPDRPLPTSGVIAVSATTLQGVWLAPGERNPYAPLLAKRPAAILGGSIYVYDLGGL